MRQEKTGEERRGEERRRGTGEGKGSKKRRVKCIKRRRERIKRWEEVKK